MLISEPVRYDIPHEKGQWMELRALSWKQLKTARKERSREVKQEMSDLSANIIEAYAKGGQAEAGARKIIRDMKYDEDQFDTQVLLSFGIAGWSYSTVADAPVTNEEIEKLDERTAVWAKQTIIDLTKPPTEVEEKNSIGASTTT